MGDAERGWLSLREVQDQVSACCLTHHMTVM